MPRTATILRVFVASPEDVAEERSCLEDVVKELNLTWSKNLGIELDLIKMETHTYPAIGTDPQDVINKQIGDDYDIFIGIMWARFGTPTGRAGSGTTEEFERAYKRFCEAPDRIRIMFYFKDAPLPPSQIEPEQLVKISAFRQGLEEKGALYWRYKDRDQFIPLVRMHLSRQVQEFQKSWGTKKEIVPATRKADLSTHELVRVANGSKIAEDEEMEEGFLDLVERGQESFGTVTEATKRMMEATANLSEKMAKRTEEFERATSTDGGTSITMAKKASNRAAEDMEQFVSRMKVEIPIFAKSHSTAINSMSRSLTLLNDFTADKKEIVKLLSIMQKQRSALMQSKEQVLTFRTTVSALPRITTVFNHAKRETVSMLDVLINEMSTASNLVFESEKVLKQVIGNL